MKIPFYLIMMNYPVNLDLCDAMPAESSFNLPEELASWILIFGIPLLLSLRTLEGDNFVTTECPASLLNVQKALPLFLKNHKYSQFIQERSEITRLLCLCEYEEWENGVGSGGQITAWKRRMCHRVICRNQKSTEKEDSCRKSWCHNFTS